MWLSIKLEVLIINHWYLYCQRCALVLSTAASWSPFYWVVMWSLWVGTLFTLYLLHLGVFIFILVKISADCKICKAFTSRIGTYHFWNQSFFYRMVHYGFFNSSRWSFSAFVFCSNNLTGCGSGIHFITWISKGVYSPGWRIGTCRFWSADVF